MELPGAGPKPSPDRRGRGGSYGRGQEAGPGRLRGGRGRVWRLASGRGGDRGESPNGREPEAGLGKACPGHGLAHPARLLPCREPVDTVAPSSRDRGLNDVALWRLGGAFWALEVKEAERSRKGRP